MKIHLNLLKLRIEYRRLFFPDMVSICCGENFFRKTQTIMVLSIPDKAEVDAKCYSELCYPDLVKDASLFYRMV